MKHSGNKTHEWEPDREDQKISIRIGEKNQNRQHSQITCLISLEKPEESTDKFLHLLTLIKIFEYKITYRNTNQPTKQSSSVTELLKRYQLQPNLNY